MGSMMGILLPPSLRLGIEHMISAGPTNLRSGFEVHDLYALCGVCDRDKPNKEQRTHEAHPT